MLTVTQNAYLRIADTHQEFDETHRKILLVLLCEKKYYSTQELLCLANHSQERLERTIMDLRKSGFIKMDGWLVKLNEEILETKMLDSCVIEATRAKTKRQ